MNILNLLQLSSEDAWFIQLLDIYHLDIFCVTCEPTVENLFIYAPFGRNIMFTFDVDFPINFLESAPDLKLLQEGRVKIVIRCKVTNTTIGYLDANGEDGDQPGQIYILSSMTAIFSELGISGRLGTKIGSLLLTVYSWILLQKTPIRKLSLESLKKSSLFYEKIGMSTVPEEEGVFYKELSSIFPGREHYQSMDLSLEIKKFIVVQRIFQHKKIKLICERLKTLSEQLKKIRLEESDKIKQEAIHQILMRLHSTDTIHNDKVVMSYARKQIILATRTYLQMPFIQQYKDIGLVRRIIEEFK